MKSTLALGAAALAAAHLVKPGEPKPEGEQQEKPKPQKHTVGETRRGTLMDSRILRKGNKSLLVQIIKDDQEQGHILSGVACDAYACKGQEGTLTFTKLDDRRGYWKFQRDITSKEIR